MFRKRNEEILRSYKKLELRFEDKNKQNVYRNQLETQIQKSSESLQEFESEFERLVQLANSDGPNDFRTTLDKKIFVAISVLSVWRRQWSLKQPNELLLRYIEFGE